MEKLEDGSTDRDGNRDEDEDGGAVKMIDVGAIVKVATVGRVANVKEVKVKIVEMVSGRSSPNVISSGSQVVLGTS